MKYFKHFFKFVDDNSSSEDEDAEKIRQSIYNVISYTAVTYYSYDIIISKGGKKPFFKRPGVWLDVKDGCIPLRAVIAGTDSHGEKVYVGRVKQNDCLLVGKIVQSHNCCYVASDGQEQASSKYQVYIPCIDNSHIFLIFYYK